MYVHSPFMNLVDDTIKKKIAKQIAMTATKKTKNPVATQTNEAGLNDSS